MKNFWVKGVLEQSLHEQILITLGMEERPDAVERPWNLMFGTTEHSARELPSDTTILSLFDSIGLGRTLLILGEPGSGKTNTLLQLARDLILQAEQDVDHLIPVVFNLSSWTPTQKQGKQTVPQSIADWLIAELNSKYEIPAKIATDWIKRQQLLLLLDGLDEVQPAHQNTCVNALNAFQQEAGTELVVCCRVRDYEALTLRLHSQMAIYIRPLTLPQIQTYLHQLQTDLSGLNALLLRDTELQELAQSPLLLNIMVFAYQGVAVDELPQNQVVKERQKQLFDAYIHRMLGKQHPSSPLKHRLTPLKYPSEQFLYWLVWLAQQMVRESQTIFLIEGMQPSWLQPRNRRLYRVLAGLIFGLRVGLRVGLMGGLMGGLIVGLEKGGQACIQHFLLRLLLYHNGSIPWNYARFLDHATERLFLQKVGGGYIFIHRLLLEHIAQLDPRTFSPEA